MKKRPFSPLQKNLLALVLGICMHFPAWAGAEAPVLSLPADCVPGTTCWLVNFVDHDPGPEARDYRCGRLSYDTHKGTDIAIANDAVMHKGVDVLAAAPGRVLRVRDGVADSTKADLESATALRGRECGNGLVIDHGDDWTTQYCHMKAGSIRVQPGDRVERGAVLGRIGRSGRSEFPHRSVHRGQQYQRLRHRRRTGRPVGAGPQGGARLPRPAAVSPGVCRGKTRRRRHSGRTPVGKPLFNIGGGAGVLDGGVQPA